MAVNEKVGILTHVPGQEKPNPGLIGGIYGDYLTKELDFLDDSRNYPLASDFTSSAAYWFGFSTDPNYPGGDWEDLATNYRAWRDAYNKSQNEYWLYREFRTRNFIPFESIEVDPMPWKNLWNGSNAMDRIRRVVPSPVDGSFNYPYPEYPGAGDHYSYANNRRALYHRYRRHHLATFSDMAIAASYQSGDAWIVDQNTPVATNIDTAYDFGTGFNSDANTLKIFRMNTGKILVAGHSLITFNGQNIIADGSACTLVQLNIDGTLDTNFNHFIRTHFNANVWVVESDADGKILIAGQDLVVATGTENAAGNIGLLRLNSDGTIDEQFEPFIWNFEGIDYQGGINVIKVDTDGTILIGGGFTSYGTEPLTSLVRLNADGTINSEFPNLSMGVQSLYLYSDGKILVAGFENNSCLIVRLNSDGTIDTTFNVATLINSEDNNWMYISALNVDSLGRIYVSGVFDTLNGTLIGTNFIRLSSDGTLETTFPFLTYAMPGFTPNPWQKSGAGKISIIENDKILLCGDFVRYGDTDCSDSILVINTDGTIDTTYDFGMGVRDWYNGGGLFVTDFFKVGSTIVLSLGLADRTYYDPAVRTPGGILAIKNVPVEPLQLASVLVDEYRYNRDRIHWLLGKKAVDVLTEEEESELTTRRADFLATDHTKLQYSLWEGDKAKQIYAYYVNQGWGRYVQDTPTSGSIDTLDIWPADTTPVEAIPGATTYNRLPAVSSYSLLPATGNPGDVVSVYDFDDVTWDPIRGIWSSALYYRFLDVIFISARATRDAKFKADNELTLALRPTLFAGLYVPAFQLTTDGNINSELKSF